MKLRPIAIYLPQFHPISENDTWWGKGFTEWTNVTKAKPLFTGHYQPHLPADLGFYDLRLPEVREEQAKLAREHGIYGFCYYHYWFNGRRILERPFQEVFESGKPDFPFMLCWANENWTRAWDGGEKHILLKQDYSEEDDRLHIRSLIPYFKDKRYLKVNNKPVFAIYRSVLLPNPAKTVKIWREECLKEGLEIYICRFENFNNIGSEYIKEAGFDAGIDFQPYGHHFEEFKKNREELRKKNLKRRIFGKFHRTVIKLINKDKYYSLLEMNQRIIDYSEYVDFLIKQPFPEHSSFPGITPMWDNYARRKKSYIIFKNSTPEKYAKWLFHIKSKFVPKTPEENLIFINAWNEWAEGNHLEPCQRWGMKYLQKTKEILCS